MHPAAPPLLSSRCSTRLLPLRCAHGSPQPSIASSLSAAIRRRARSNSARESNRGAIGDRRSQTRTPSCAPWTTSRICGRCIVSWIDPSVHASRAKRRRRAAIRGAEPDRLTRIGSSLALRSPPRPHAPTSITRSGPSDTRSATTDQHQPSFTRRHDHSSCCTRPMLFRNLTATTIRVTSQGARPRVRQRSATH